MWGLNEAVYPDNLIEYYSFVYFSSSPILEIVILDKSNNNVEMKNLLIFLLISTTSFAQNKKEQIEILNFRVDSLNTVLATTRDNSAKDISILNDKIKKVRDELTNLQTSNNKLSKENDKLKTDLGELSKQTSFKTVKIGNLEVYPYDLGDMKWDEAMKICAYLGEGWRLPTKDELHVLFWNKDKIRCFASANYWSSTEFVNYRSTDFDKYYAQNFNSGNHYQFHKNSSNNVRAVRTF
jgi:regulator of replication initiation timing